jgi:hypothetical protein
MASVRDLVEAGFDENLVKQAVDSAGFVRTRGRGGLNLNAKDVAKVLKAYNALLAKLTAKVAKFNPDKLNYDEDEAPAPKAKVKVEKKAPAKATKAKAKPPVDDDEEEEGDEPEADDQDDDDVEESDDEEDDE